MYPKFILIVLIALICAGCGQGVAVFAPTPLPPDVSPLQYDHPSGAFSVEVPRTWSVHAQNTTTLAAAEFTPPGLDEPLLGMAVIHLDDSSSTLSDIVNSYQSQIRPDAGRYVEQTRQEMIDGSWRLTGLRITPGGLPQQVNTFIEQSDAFVAIVEAVITQDTDRLNELESAVNSFQFSPSESLQPAALSLLASTTRSDLVALHISTWSTGGGVFFVTGEVANHTDRTIRDLPVRVLLQAADGTGIAEAVDHVMGYGIQPGEFAPFSLRFGQGKPPEATGYELTLGNDAWRSTDTGSAEIYGAETLVWTDESTITREGHLLITGTVTNTSSYAVRAPIATVTVFDSTQHVIAAGFTVITDGILDPEDSIEFAVRVPELGDDPAAAHYIVNVQALPDE